MATLLDAPKANASKYEEFVGKQIEEVRKRIRLVDILSVSLTVLASFFLFLFVALLIDRYVSTKPGVGWAALSCFLLISGIYAYIQLFRKSRNTINPYYAARKVEEAIADHKNSVVNWIDLHEDEKVAPSIKVALSAKAAKDLKQADLTKIGEAKSFLWTACLAGFFALGAAVVFFLPPTRTDLVQETPKEGDTTVFSGEDIRFEVRILGRIPKATDPDSAKLRIWYNPEDPENFEDRALDVSVDDRRLWGITVKGNQVRKGFDYQLRAAGVETPKHHITCKIIPILTGFDVIYKLPAYLGKPDEKTNDPNLFNYYGTEVTLLASTNRTVKSGYLQIEGQPRTYDAEIPADRPDALLFRFPMEKNGGYRIFFTTTEGDRNSDPQKYRIALLDAKPVFTKFDLKFQYPEYLRWKMQMLENEKTPDIEAIRGTEVTITAYGNRPVKSGRLLIPDEINKATLEVVGEPIPDQPMALKFKLPKLDEDKTCVIRFTPTTGEGESDPRPLVIRVLRDELPQVRITLPKEEMIELPLNDTLKVEGIATDDHGISRMNLRMEVVAPRVEALKEKPYRDGKEFKREKDNSYPTLLNYKDQVELSQLRGFDPKFQIAEGMIIEYWLEAIDNCDVPPGPNRGYSNRQKVKILAPAKAADKVQQQQKKREEFAKEKQQFDAQQDKKNEEEKRDPAQPEPKQPGENQPGEPKNANGQPEVPKKDPNAQDQPGKNPGQGNSNDQKTQSRDPGSENSNNQPGAEKKNRKADPKAMPNKENKGVDDKDTKPGSESGGESEKDKELQRQADRIQKALNDKNTQAKKDPSGKESNNPPEQSPMPGESGSPKSQPVKGSNPQPKADGTKNDPGRKSDEKSETAPMPKESADPKKDQSNPSKSESGPGSPGKPDEKNSQQGTPPEPGELSREIASKDYKMNSRQKEDVDRLLRDPKKKQEMQNELDKMKNDIQDPQKKRDFEKDVEQTKKNAQEKEDIDQLSKKSKSPDPQEAQKAQRDLDQKMQNPDSRQNGQKLAEEKANQKSEGGAQQQQQALENSMNKGRENNLKEAASKMQSDDPNRQAEGKKEMDKLMQDPATRQMAEKMKDDLAKNAGDEKKKEDFQKQMKDSAQKGQKENVDQIAKNAESNNPRDQEQAAKEQKNLEKNDPQAGKEAAQKMEQAQQNRAANQQAKNEPGKQNTKQSGGKSNEGGSEQPDLQQEMNQLDREMNSKDAKFDKAKQDRLERLLRDEKLRAEAEKKAKEWEKNAPNDQTRNDLKNKVDEARDNAKAQEKMEKDVDRLTKKQSKPENKDPNQNAPKDGDKTQKNATGNTEKNDGGQSTEQAKKDLEEMLKDPKNRQQAEKLADQMEKKNPEAAQELRNAADKARQDSLKDSAQKSGEKSSDQQKQNIADLMKDPKTRDMAGKMMKDMLDQAKDPEKRKNLEEAMKNAMDQARKNDLKDLAQQAKDQKQQEQAAKELQDLLKKDPEMQKMMQDLAKQMQDPEVQKGLQELKKKADELAQNRPKDKEPAPRGKEGKNDAAKKEGDNAASKGKEGKEDTAQGDPKQDPKADPKNSKDPKMDKGELAKKDQEGNKLGGKAPKDGNLKGELPVNPASGGGEDKIDPMVADLKNKVKAAELQLEDFRKNKSNKEMLKQVEMTPEQYEQFLKSAEEALNRERQRLVELEKKEAKSGSRSKGASMLNRGSETIKLEGNSDSKTERGTRGNAPPGFDDAYKRATSGSASGSGDPK